MNIFREKRWIIGLFLLVVLARDVRAQYPSLRATDTRTSVPEDIIGNRQDWGMDASYGGNFNRGNADVDYISSSLSLFKKITPSSSTIYLDGAQIYNTFDGTKAIDQGAVAVRYDYPIAGPLKIFAFNTNAYNEFIKLDYRDTTGVGPWYDFNFESIKDGASLAIAYEYEHYEDQVYNRDERFSFRDMAKIPLSKVASIQTDFFYLPRVDMVDDYRLYGEIDVQSLIWKDIVGIKVSWIDEYQSVTQPGVKPNDSIWVTAFTLCLGK